MKRILASLIVITAFCAPAFAETPGEKEMHSFGYVTNVSTPHATEPAYGEDHYRNSMDGHRHQGWEHHKGHHHHGKHADKGKHEHHGHGHHHHHHKDGAAKEQPKTQPAAQ